MSKSKEMEALLREMFPSRKNMDAKLCVFCHQPAESFRDEISAREYEISGICQICQDKVFKEFNDE